MRNKNNSTFSKNIVQLSHYEIFAVFFQVSTALTFSKLQPAVVLRKFLLFLNISTISPENVKNLMFRFLYRNFESKFISKLRWLFYFIISSFNSEVSIFHLKITAFLFKNFDYCLEVSTILIPNLHIVSWKLQVLISKFLSFCPKLRLALYYQRFA